MPYYNDKTFDVDCIAQNGIMRLCITRLRTYQNPLSPTNEGCKIMRNKKVILLGKKDILFHIENSIELDLKKGIRLSLFPLNNVNGVKSILYKFKVFNIIRLMKNSTLGMLIVIAGVLTIFVKHEYAWIVSAILIGGGTGLFFWKDKE